MDNGAYMAKNINKDQRRKYSNSYKDRAIRAALGLGVLLPTSVLYNKAKGLDVAIIKPSLTEILNKKRLYIEKGVPENTYNAFLSPFYKELKPVIRKRNLFKRLSIGGLGLGTGLLLSAFYKKPKVYNKKRKER